MLQPSGEDPHPGVLGLLPHRARGLDHVGEFLLGEDHRAVVERDQVLRHPMTPLPAPTCSRLSALLPTALPGSDASLAEILSRGRNSRMASVLPSDDGAPPQASIGPPE